jgi:hypothetical protein
MKPAPARNCLSKSVYVLFLVATASACFADDAPQHHSIPFEGTKPRNFVTDPIVPPSYNAGKIVNMATEPSTNGQVSVPGSISKGRPVPLRSEPRASSAVGSSSSAMQHARIAKGRQFSASGVK